MVAALKVVDGSAATRAAKLCFRFLVLTAARGGEARLATWDEIDLKVREWRIPGQRMKTGREHVVPLSDAALAVLTDAAVIACGPIQDVMELAPAHTVGSAVERAYARSDLRSKRRTPMQRWGEYVTADRANVVKLHG